MPRLALTGGAYQARSVIASAQRSLNLYAEPMPQPQGEPAPMANYPTPGLTALGALPQAGIRGIRQCTTGQIYAVAGDGVYRVDPNAWTGALAGSITALRPYPVSMADNGNTLVIVDGTAGGWTVDLPSGAFAAISDPSFYGADRVDYLDTYFLFNKPKTPQFYSSDSLATTFDPLWFANKESTADLLVTLIVSRREIWLLGTKATEVWYDVGAPDFPFGQVPGIFVDHGCCAKYSVAEYDNTVYWLDTNPAGQGIVLTGFGGGYLTKRISTFAIEETLRTYPTISDAIGFVYSLGGHTCYVLAFPTADHTWVYDITTGQWHEWLWIDNDGHEHRHRANCCYNCNGTIVVGDWQNGNLYKLDADSYTDAGQPIKRVRSFPHVLNDLNRVFYRNFVADIESGNPGAAPQSDIVTLLSCSFTAPDGTPLSAYSFPGDTDATWTLVSGTDADITSDELTGPPHGGASLYKSPSVSDANYTLQFSAIPSYYTAVPTGEIYAVARSTGPGTGYLAMVSGDGSQYWLMLGVEGGSSTMLAMGTLSAGAYTVRMMLQSTTISVTVQRSSDGLWLGPSGVWSTASVPAMTLVDGTYSAAGMVLIGGSW